MKLSRSLIPDLSALQAFEAAARHGSFTRAAVELNLTQSAVSRQIKDLETQLGVALFERVRQRIVLSTAGRHLRPEAEQLLAGLERLTLRAASARDATGHLTIATLPTFGSRWLMPRLPEFLSQHPGLQATVVTRSGVFDMAAEGVDIAIHYGAPVWAGGDCTYLCRETVVPVAAPSLLNRFGPERLLEQAPLLHLTSRPMLWADWLAQNGHSTAEAFHGHRFEQFALLIEAAKAGLGLALVPGYLIEREVQQDRLHVVFDGSLTTDAAYHVVLPESRVSDRLSQGFVDWILGEV